MFLRSVPGSRCLFATAAALGTLTVVAGSFGWALSRGVAAERRTSQRRPTVWVWDCAAAPHWRETMRTSDADMARMTADRFNKQYNASGKFYTVTEGDAPQELVNCESSRGAAKGAAPGLFDEVIDAAPTSRSAPLTGARTPFDARPVGKGTSTAGGTGKLVLLTATRQNFGAVSPGQSGTQVFEVKNPGPGDLTLRLVEKSCGCTSVRIDGNELSPGLSGLGELVLEPIPDGQDLPGLQSPAQPDGKIGSANELPIPSNVEPAAPAASDGLFEQIAPEAGNDTHVIPAGHGSRIEVSVNTSDAGGAIHQRVKFSTSDPNHAAVEFEVEGEVILPIEVSSPWLSVEGLKSDQALRRTIRITSKVIENLQIKHVTASEPSFAVRSDRLSHGLLKSEKLKSGFDVHVDIPAGQPAGLMQATITIATNSAEKPLLTIPVLGRVHGDVTLLPIESFDFGPVTAGEEVMLGLYGKIQTATSADVKVARVQPGFLKVELLKPAGLAQGQQVFVVEATLMKTAPVGEFQGTIELETTHGTPRKIRIPVLGNIVAQPSETP